MGSDHSPCAVPVIDFSSVLAEVSRGTDGWLDLCNRVRDACENHGCFEAVYDKIPQETRTEVFSALEELFALPLETKMKNDNPKPFHAYYVNGLYESFGMENASNFQSLKSFVELLWPDGNDSFSRKIVAMVELLEKLNNMIGLSILDSYGLGEDSDSIIPCKTLLRVMRYEAPPKGEVMDGLLAHTDKPLMALLCDNRTGLKIETKDGQWIQFSPSQNSYLFIVGDPLMAWSNGRMHAAKHKVIMEGEKDRYSMAAFRFPVEGTFIKPQEKFIDKEHPRILRDFDFMDFAKFSFLTDEKDIQSSRHIFEFAGIDGN